MKKVIVSICLCLLLPSAALAASTREDLQAHRCRQGGSGPDHGRRDKSIPMNILEQAPAWGWCRE